MANTLPVDIKITPNYRKKPTLYVIRSLAPYTHATLRGIRCSRGPNSTSM